MDATKRGCHICDCERQLDEDIYDRSKEVEIAWRTFAGKDTIGRTYVRADYGDTTERYYPQYCPECGIHLTHWKLYRELIAYRGEEKSFGKPTHTLVRFNEDGTVKSVEDSYGQDRI